MSDPKKNRAFTILGAAAAGLTLVGSIYYWWSSGTESTDDAQVAADIVPIAPRVQGLVMKVAVVENQSVKKGEPLVLLDDAEVAAQSTQAQLTQAKAQLSAAEEQKRAAESRVSEAQGRVEQSTPISAQIATARANAALAHARVEAAKASLELARLELSYTKITAPTDGTASSATVPEGALVMPGQMMIRLVPSRTYVIANFKETQIGRMKPGDSAEIEIDAFSPRKFSGKVESLSGGTGASFALIPPDNASGNFVKVVQRVPVRISFKEMPSDTKLRAGLSADVTVRCGH